MSNALAFNGLEEQIKNDTQMLKLKFN